LFYGTQKRLAVTAELYELAVRYWDDVDYNGGRTAADFFTEDGVFQGHGQVHRGRRQISEFYAWREGRGDRVSVHAIANFSIKELTDTQAVTTHAMFLYAADGEPILPVAPPNLIAHVVDTIVRDAPDAPWLYKHRLFESLFRGGAPTTTMPGREP
jgi:hypothetical protein